MKNPSLHESSLNKSEQPASSTLVERLKTPLDCEASLLEWDKWRRMITTPHVSSDLPRMCFESFLENIDEERAEAAARITELEAELLRVKSYLSDAGWETVQSEQAWKARALAAESQLERVRAEAWQPIETAPKDGTLIELWRPVSDFGKWQQRIVGCWYVFDDDSDAQDGVWIWPDGALPEIDLVSREWIANDDYYEDPESFTHWRPLPAPPQQKTDAPTTTDGDRG